MENNMEALIENLPDLLNEHPIDLSHGSCDVAIEIEFNQWAVSFYLISDVKHTIISGDWFNAPEFDSEKPVISIINLKVWMNDEIYYPEENDLELLINEIIKHCETT